MFMLNFGSTLDGLGEPAADATVVDSVKSFVVTFIIIGALSGVSGFVMVAFWTIAGESQARHDPARSWEWADLSCVEPKVVHIS